MQEIQVPNEVKEFAQEWTTDFINKNPYWDKTHEGFDDWDSKSGYDINLYICAGCLTTTAYLLVDDGSGYLTADTMSYEKIVTIDKVVTTDKEEEE